MTSLGAGHDIWGNLGDGCRVSVEVSDFNGGGGGAGIVCARRSGVCVGALARMARVLDHTCTIHINGEGFGVKTY